MPTTPDESGNRTRVALWLADAFEATDAGITGVVPLPNVVAALPDVGWRLAVDHAQALHPDWDPPADYVPSQATRSAVITVLRERAKPDPFAGFPQ